MPMINCRLVDSDNHVQALIDSEGAQRLTTHLHSPFRTLLHVGDEVIAAMAHTNLRAAIRFHRGTAHTMHNPRFVIAEAEMAQ